MSTRTLDYGDNYPFSGVIGRTRHLAWPVHAYRITIPATLSAGRGLLNPFERVILNVIDAVGRLDEDALAQETCIPVDLVRTVILRLRDKGLINDDNLIIDRNRRSWEEEIREENYTSALAFRELVGGRLLPFVQILDDRNPLRTKVVDRPTPRRLPQDHASSRLGPPSARDVISIITQMKRRSEAYAKSTRTPAIEQIRIEREPEVYLLDCPIAVQAHDAEFRIADPFGTGFSRVLENVFSIRLETDEKLQEWMTNWRQALSIPRARDGEESQAREPFDTYEIRRRYPKLVRALIPSRGAQHRSVEDIYASLEWALYYTCEMHDPQVAIRRLKQGAGNNYSQWLSGVAEGLGFEVPRYGFRPVPDGKLDDYLNQKPEMETVLGIALLQAEADYGHPLRRIASARPDFIGRIRTLASDRGDRAHGKHVTVANGAQLESDPFMREIISALLPVIQFDSNAKSTDAGSQADLLLDARTRLQDAFGYHSFNKLGLSAQASLLTAEQFWLVCRDGDDARAFISNLYSALQGVLREFLSRTVPVGVREGEYKEQAGVKADLAGLGQLPGELASVSPRRIREALQGNDLSVGASVIALLLTASQEVLKEIANSQPDFLAAIVDILAKRGHANQPAPMQKADAGKLRKSAISTVRTLLELIQED
jgi:hypothetical protein